MPHIRLENVVLTGIVTLGSGIQLFYFARRVYRARERYNVEYPAVTGHPDFERIYQAQQNALELYPIYMTSLWTSSLFLHQVPSAIFGVIYIISQHRYFKGCADNVEGRQPVALAGARVLMAMSAMAAVGLFKTLLWMHCNNGFGRAFRPVFRPYRFH